MKCWTTVIQDTISNSLIKQGDALTTLLFGRVLNKNAKKKKFTCWLGHVSPPSIFDSRTGQRIGN
jgi:hypothetical protein